MALREVQRERLIRAPRAIVWGIVADTNRWDRAAGLATPRYDWVVVDGVRRRRAQASELGFELEWIEPAYSWVEGRNVEGERHFRKGPATRGGFRVRLDDHAQGTLVRACAWLDAPIPLVWIQELKFHAALGRYLEAVASALDGSVETGNTAVPAVVRARAQLAAKPSNSLLAPRGEIDRARLEQRAAQLQEAGAPPTLVTRLVAWLAERPDEDVESIRVYQLASEWGVDRRVALGLFLKATTVGLTELAWHVLCPVCRVAAGAGDHLDSVGSRQHCDACDIDYDVDFARHVEAVFRPHPAVREVRSKLYCASSPAFLPHVVAQLRIPPGGSRSESIDLPRGEVLLRIVGRQGARTEELDLTPATLDITLANDGVHASVGATTVDSSTRLTVTNTLDAEATLSIERNGWSADAVLGTAIASMPEFAGLFAVEAPQSGVELHVGHLALLFTDLTGSTALYERAGDARAFALVQQHFQVMTEVVGRHGGAIVKTMGDAVMASFPTFEEAVAAGIAMVGAHEEALGKHGFGVKIGVHAGPCLAVRANDRLDYFGTTVNVAARLQARAEDGEVVVLADRFAALATSTLPLRRFEVQLKGIHLPQRLVALDARSQPVPRQ